MAVDYILRFAKSVRTALWGEERWLVSAHPAMPGVIANGPLSGMRLDAVLPGFPIVVKRILSHDRLSVQVHPNERTAALSGGEPKTEAWLALGDSQVYAGFVAGATPGEVSAAAASGSGVERLLALHGLRKGESILIRGGLVHAIGPGADLLEVQQSSDTTYRFYDWGRVGPDGRPRELHVASALAAADFTLPAPSAADGVSCPFFTMRQCRVSGEMTLSAADGHRCIYVAEGEVSAEGETFAAGELALVPRGLEARLSSSGAAVVEISAPSDAH